MDRNEAREFLSKVCYERGDPDAGERLLGPSISHIQTSIALDAIVAAYKRGWGDQCDVVSACLV